MVVAVREREEVKRLHQDRVDATCGNVGDERASVRAGVRIRGAELGQIRVAERVPLREFLDRAPAVDVEKHDPRIRVHPASPRRAHEIGDEIPLADQLTDHGLKPQPAETARRRLEEDGAGLLEVDDPPRIVREDVSGVVVRRGQRYPSRPGALLNVVGDNLEPLVEEVGREGEQ